MTKGVKELFAYCLATVLFLVLVGGCGMDGGIEGCCPERDARRDKVSTMSDDPDAIGPVEQIIGSDRFGGMYFDGDRIVVLVTEELPGDAAALAALTDGIEINVVRYTEAQLRAWQQLVSDAGGVNRVSVDLKRSKVMIGVSDVGAYELPDGIPEDVVEVIKEIWESKGGSLPNR